MEVVWLAVAFVAGGVVMNYLGIPIKNWLHTEEKAVGAAVKTDVTTLKGKL